MSRGIEEDFYTYIILATNHKSVWNNMCLFAIIIESRFSKIF